jgi:hypothetical protein
MARLRNPVPLLRTAGSPPEDLSGNERAGPGRPLRRSSITRPRASPPNSRSGGGPPFPNPFLLTGRFPRQLEREISRSSVVTPSRALRLRAPASPRLLTSGLRDLLYEGVVDLGVRDDLAAACVRVAEHDLDRLLLVGDLRSGSRSRRSACVPLATSCGERQSLAVDCTIAPVRLIVWSLGGRPACG